MRSLRLSHPPEALRRPGVKWDNLALVPASLLPMKAKWQTLANELSEGDILIILPPTETASKKALEKVAAQLKAQGHQVSTLSAARFG